MTLKFKLYIRVQVREACCQQYVRVITLKLKLCIRI